MWRVCLLVPIRSTSHLYERESSHFILESSHHTKFIRIYVAEWGIRMHDIICHIKFHRHRDRTLRTRQIITATMRGSLLGKAGFTVFGAPGNCKERRDGGLGACEGLHDVLLQSMRAGLHYALLQSMCGAPLCPFAEHMRGSTTPFCRASEGLRYALLRGGSIMPFCRACEGLHYASFAEHAKASIMQVCRACGGLHCALLQSM